MGKGKGSFDHWASRIAVSKVIFELKGDVHEQVARDAFRLAGNKMPGKFYAVLETRISAVFMRLTTIVRYVRVCEEGRPSRCWNYQAGWHYHGGIKEATASSTFAYAYQSYCASC